MVSEAKTFSFKHILFGLAHFNAKEGEGATVIITRLDFRLKKWHQGASGSWFEPLFFEAHLSC